MGIETAKLGIDEWISVTQSKEGKNFVPITLHTTSGSMIPYIRRYEDAVVVVPCNAGDVQIGDVVLIRKAGSGAGVLLHRLYRIKNGKIVTLGDNMRRPDREEDADMILGRAVSITGPGKSIDCDRWWRRLQGKAIVMAFPLRPAFFMMRRVLRKLRGTARQCGESRLLRRKGDGRG